MKTIFIVLLAWVYQIIGATAGELVVYNGTPPGLIIPQGASIVLDKKEIGYIGSKQVLRKRISAGVHTLNARNHGGLVNMSWSNITFLSQKRPLYFRYLRSGRYITLQAIPEKQAHREIAGLKRATVTKRKPSIRKQPKRTKTNFNR